MEQKVKNQVVIQARMGSSRLPGKVLMPLSGYSVIEHVVYRAAAAARVDRVVVATTDLKQDDEIALWCNNNNIACVRGSSDDVLARYIKAANTFECDNIIRITADCPLTDPGILDSLLLLHEQTDSDYTANVINPTYPQGFDAEIVKFSVLKNVSEITDVKSHREHVTLYIRENLDKFKHANLSWGGKKYNARLTLDHIQDYEVIKQVFSLLATHNRLFSIYAVCELIDSQPEIFALNTHIDRYEGLKKSLDTEKRQFKL